MELVKSFYFRSANTRFTYQYLFLYFRPIRLVALPRSTVIRIKSILQPNSSIRITGIDQIPDVTSQRT